MSTADKHLPWGELQGEHDFIMWRLGQIHAELSAPDTRAPIERMIDQATGREGVTLAELTSEANALMARCEDIRAELTRRAKVA